MIHLKRLGIGILLLGSFFATIGSIIGILYLMVNYPIFGGSILLLGLLALCYSIGEDMLN